MFWIIGIVSALGLLAWWQFSPTTYRYKLTVEVETPEGLRSGSAVREVRWAKGVQLTMEADTAMMMHKGEAVVVDLPNGQTLFALMSPDGQETPMLAFGSARQSRWSDRSVKLLEPPTEMQSARGRSGFPLLVRFQDISDPETVKQVDPNDLSTSIGIGYRLRRVTAQIVDEKVTENMHGRLKWLSGYPEPRLAKLPSGGTTDPTFAQQLTHGVFTRGIQR